MITSGSQESSRMKKYYLVENETGGMFFANGSIFMEERGLERRFSFTDEGKAEAESVAARFNGSKIVVRES